MQLENKWLVAVPGAKKEVPIVENVTVIYQEDTDFDSAPKFLNHIGNLTGYDYVVCLGGGYNIAGIESYQTFQKYLNLDIIHAFGALYSDINIVDVQNDFICSQYKPSYDIKLRNSGMILNIPFVSSMKRMPIFDERIKNLYLWDGLLTIASEFLLFHIPDALFTINNALDTLSIEEDVKYVQERHFKK